MLRPSWPQLRTSGGRLRAGTPLRLPLSSSCLSPSKALERNASIGWMFLFTSGIAGGSLYWPVNAGTNCVAKRSVGEKCLIPLPPIRRRPLDPSPATTEVARASWLAMAPLDTGLFDACTDSIFCALPPRRIYQASCAKRLRLRGRALLLSSRRGRSFLPWTYSRAGLNYPLSETNYGAEKAMCSSLAGVS